MSIGQKLSELMSERRLSRARLADELKISYSALNNYLRDDREPSVEMLKRMAEYFGVTVDYLLDFHPPVKNAVSVVINESEQELLNTYNRLKSEQREFVVEQIKLLARINEKNERA